MLLENYLQEIQRGSSLRKPSPTFAYELVYGKSPAGFRRGRFPGKYESKIWNGISVDSHLKDEWLDGLNSIKEIEMRGSCEGHTKEWITFITFRITNKSKESDEKYLDKIVKTLSKNKYTHAGWEFGMQGRPRVVVAAPLFYGCSKQDEWDKWWTNIVKNVKKAL